MRIFLFFIFLLISSTSVAQLRDANGGLGKMPKGSKVDLNDTLNSFNGSDKQFEKAPHNLYKIYNLEKDTTLVDTSLTLKSEYKFNFLKKDNFGLIAFANEGHTYNTLNFGLQRNNVFPSFGFKGKHFNYLEVNDIKYYSVPTPLTELYFKTVMEQGQSVDAFLTVNTKPNLNFSIGYKGIRSLGKYVNSLSSSGNFRFTSSYFTQNRRYILNAHFTGQDISNQEYGGIINTDDFEINEEEKFTERERIDVYFNDATSFLKGNRFFLNHSFRFSKENQNGIVITHQLNQEYKFFEFWQTTKSNRLGNTFSNKINDKTRYNHLYNKIGLAYKSSKLGDLEFFIDDNKYNYYYNNVILDSNGNITIPNAINDRINSIGGSYSYFKENIIGKISISNAITDQSISNIEANLSYKLNEDYQFKFTYQKINSLPNLNYTLYQNDYINYNWYNNFKNEKNNLFKVEANTKWINLEFQYKIINDYLYFDNESNDISTLVVKPKQFENTINYLSLKASKEIKYGKFALDNTLLFQQVEQSSDVLNVPQIITRNTIYFTDKVFKKAMQLQTGIIFNYFTSFYANDYNPIIGEFYTQNEKKIGNFPMLDFFVNARVRQTRIFLKAEHFNSAWTGNDYYSAPNYPYRDFIVRFGLVWNFFQ